MALSTLRLTVTVIPYFALNAAAMFAYDVGFDTV